MALPRKKCPRKGIVALLQGFPVQTTGVCDKRKVGVTTLDGDRTGFVPRGKLKALSEKQGERVAAGMYMLDPVRVPVRQQPVDIVRFQKPERIELPRGLPQFMDGLDVAHFNPLPPGLGKSRDAEGRKLSRGEREYQKRMMNMMRDQQEAWDAWRDGEESEVATELPLNFTARSLPMSPRVMRGRGAHFEGLGALDSQGDLKLATALVATDLQKSETGATRMDRLDYAKSALARANKFVRLTPDHLRDSSAFAELLRQQRLAEMRVQEFRPGFGSAQSRGGFRR